MESILGPNLKSGNGFVPTNSLDVNKPILLYFSASWCPPCRQFTPVLSGLYNQVNQGGNKQFEVIYVSWDQTIQQYNDYYSHMPWLAVPFENTAVKESLYSSFGINGVPTLVLIGKNGGPLSKDGRKDVMTQGPAAVQTWQRLLG